MKPVQIEFLMVDHLSARLDKAVGKIERMSQQASSANRQIRELDRSGSLLNNTVGKLAAAFTIKELVSNITKVRGEFQQLEVSFQTMLGSAEKADTLMQQLVHTAATTPFGLEDVAQGAKQLLAYGFEAEKVNETLIRLGDIAAGLSIPLNDLVYLYGTTMSQGRLYTQDLNQFTGRGIPMIAELAKQFGVAESKVKELVEEGKVGFPEVQKVIESLTDEGGKFGGLMEAQSKTITGQISNIEDAVSMMFNEIGQQSEGVINTTLSGVSYMVEHYERFGRILLGLVGTYGVYRTAVMTVTAVKGWAVAAEALHYNWLLLVEKAQKMLNRTMLSNPYVLVATLLAGVAVALISMKTETERLQESEERYQQQKQKTIEAEEEHRRKIEELCSIAGDEAVSTDARREALNKLEQKYPDIFSKYDTEYEKLKNIKKIKEEIARLEAGESISNPANELKRVDDRIKELEGKTRLATEYYQDSYGRQRARYVQKSARSRDEEAELQNLYGKRKSLNGQIRKDEVNAYFENLTGVSNETLAQQIKQRRTLLARMSVQEKEYGKITQGDENLTGTYSRDELKYQLNKLVSEQNRRNLPTDSSTDWVAAAKEKYQDALKAYNAFLQETSNSLSREEFEKKAKELKDAVDTYKVGGLLFSGGKMQTQAELTNQAQRMAKLPLMITFDGEWGLAMRLRGTPVFPRNMVLGCIQDNRLIHAYGREVARQCKQIGAQVNFAPVADVNINPKNPVINTRSFGENPIQVADKVIAYASGLEEGGVLSVCKHFPGHGDTDIDSHKALPVLPFTRERLDSVELYPFKRAIRAGLGGMMVGHLQVPIIEPVGGLPSSLSRNVVYDLLTDELAFRGLIFTDALAMKGVSGNGSVSLQALKAKPLKKGS